MCEESHLQREVIFFHLFEVRLSLHVPRQILTRQRSKSTV